MRKVKRRGAVSKTRLGNIPLSAYAVSIEDLENPKVEAFPDNGFPGKNRVRPPQNAPVGGQNHCLEKKFWYLL